jgi:hypothetical protein
MSGRWWRCRRVVGGIVMASGVMSTCLVAAVSAPRTAAAAAPSSGSALRAPLAAAVTTPSGSWAVVAMGQRGVALNTFWEIFYRASGTASWKLVTPTGVADNGGLTLTAGLDGSAIAGFEPSQLLHYSPLARSNDDGATWSPGLVPTSLLAVPDAVAVAGPNGPVLALVRRGTGNVMISSGSLLRWTPLPGPRSLTGGTTSRCAVTSLDAVAYGPSATPLLGTGCRRPGQVGVFARVGTSWQLIGPTLTGASARDSTNVLRLSVSGATESALVAAGAPGRSVLLGQWRAADGTWAASRPLPVSPSQRVLATAIGESGQEVVLLSQRGTSGTVRVAPGPGQGWSTLPRPPAGTATVALLSDGSVDAFSVQGNRLRVYTASAPTDRWALTQSMNVPLAYGSS